MLVAAVLALTVATAACPEGAAADARPNQVVVGLSQPLDQLPAVQAVLGLPIVESVVDRQFYVLVRTRPTVLVPDPVQSLIAQLTGLAGVRYAEPNFIYGAAQAQFNDPLLGQQDDLVDTEAVAGWLGGAGAGMTIAVLDTGVDLDHPDLAAGIVRNDADVPGNGIDDDGNGAVDDHRGWNVTTRAGDGNDDGGHGTEVAGVAAARAGNSIGIAGVAFQAGILPVKVLAADGSGDGTDVADGIRYALSRGARVINLSLIGPDRAQVIEDAVVDAQKANAIVVVAAGNQARNLDTGPMYPVSYPQPNVLAVGAHAGEALTSFSNRGGAVDLSAPGDGVLSTIRGGEFGSVAGTSIASPLAAGAAAVVWAARKDLDAAGVVGALMTAAATRPVGGTVTGKLSVARALGLTPDQIASTLARTPFVNNAAAVSGEDSQSETQRNTSSGNRRTSRATRRVRVSMRAIRRLRGRRVLLSWKVLSGRAKRFVIRVDGRRVKRVSGATRAALVRVRRGRHRIQVEAQNAKGKRLGSTSRRLTIRPR
jgi:subtilisin family serine protease